MVWNILVITCPVMMSDSAVCHTLNHSLNISLIPGSLTSSAATPVSPRYTSCAGPHRKTPSNSRYFNKWVILIDFAHSSYKVQTLTPYSKPASELYRPSDLRLSTKLVPTFADRRCHVVSVTDSLRPYSRISRPEPLRFLLSSSSIVLTRLSGPHFWYVH
jgi:hypothetical protein